MYRILRWQKIILELDVEYPKNLHDLPFLSELRKVKKCNKLVCDLFNKEKYIVDIRTFKASIKSWINF